MSDPWQKTVNVTLNSVDLVSGTGQFTISPAGADPLPTGPDGLIFKNAGHNGFNIDFVLIDATDQGYTFPPDSDKTQAVSSQLGGTNLCPPQGRSEVLNPIRISGQNSDTLSVYNPNQKKCVGLFSYVLWVTNDGGANYIKLDPGGNNMNGGIGQFSWTVAVGATAVIAIVAIFALYKLHLFAT